MTIKKTVNKAFPVKVTSFAFLSLGVVNSNVSIASFAIVFQARSGGSMILECLLCHATLFNPGYESFKQLLSSHYSTEASLIHESEWEMPVCYAFVSQIMNRTIIKHGGSAHFHLTCPCNSPLNFWKLFWIYIFSWNFFFSLHFLIYFLFCQI